MYSKFISALRFEHFLYFQKATTSRNTHQLYGLTQIRTSLSKSLVFSSGGSKLFLVDEELHYRGLAKESRMYNVSS